MPREDHAPDADASRRGGGWLWLRGGAIAGLAVGAFALSCAASLPASVIARYVAPPVEINGYFGTLWSGELRLRGGFGLAWRLDPAGAITAGRLAFDLALTGPETGLEGRMTAGLPPGEDLRLANLRGRAGWALVAAMVPETPIACDAVLRVEDLALARTAAGYGGSGVLRSEPGACVRLGRETAPVMVPALEARIAEDADGIAARVSLDGRPEAVLAEAELTKADLLLLRVTPEGAALVPGMQASGDVTLEFPLSALR